MSAVRLLHTVALLAERPALASLLAATLAAGPGLRVRSFESGLALAAYARIAPVDLVVADLDDPAFDAELVELCGAPVPIIGLARHPVRTAGVAEVIGKPMSPRYLLERVAARLRSGRPQPPPRESLRRAPLPANVVRLFPERPGAPA